MNDIAKIQEEFFELTDLEKEIEQKLLTETDPVEIKKLKLTLSAIANTIEVTDLEIKQACVNQELEDFYQGKVKEAKEMSAFLESQNEGSTFPYENFLDAKDIWYEFWAIKAAEAADDAADEVYSFPDEPINSWES